jgi:hypothetical protein
MKLWSFLGKRSIICKSRRKKIFIIERNNWFLHQRGQFQAADKFIKIIFENRYWCTLPQISITLYMILKIQSISQRHFQRPKILKKSKLASVSPESHSIFLHMTPLSQKQNNYTDQEA